jgi:hypothetical protein
LLGSNAGAVRESSAIAKQVIELLDNEPERRDVQTCLSLWQVDDLAEVAERYMELSTRRIERMRFQHAAR